MRDWWLLKWRCKDNWGWQTMVLREDELYRNFAPIRNQVDVCKHLCFSTFR
jgi:hypothetical protein